MLGYLRQTRGHAICGLTFGVLADCVVTCVRINLSSVVVVIGASPHASHSSMLIRRNAAASLVSFSFIHRSKSWTRTKIPSVRTMAYVQMNSDRDSLYARPELAPIVPVLVVVLVLDCRSAAS